MLARILFFSLAILSMNFPLCAQSRVQIDDADLSFSYILPKGWSNMDDDYYHYLLNADSTILISITYFDGMCKDLETCYAGEVEGKLRSEYAHFNIIDQSTESIAGSNCKWLRFTGKLDGLETRAMSFYFIRHDQFFKIVANLPPDVKVNEEDTVLRLMRSFETSVR